MGYFSEADHNSVLSIHNESLQGDNGLQRVYKRLIDLQRNLAPHLKTGDFRLHPAPGVPGGVMPQSVTSPFPVNALSITFMRSGSEAVVAEGIMGRDGSTAADNIEAHRHPAIELRLTPDHFAIELVIGPDAWCDQRNFVGKMSIDQHRIRFFQLLAAMESDYCLGFWSGVHLSDMHFSTAQLPPARILFEYLDTFAAGRDWLRIGCWYEVGDERLNSETIQTEVLKRIRELYSLYEFALWTSNNNFHTFYAKAYSA
jgi:hypothetical protein